MEENSLEKIFREYSKKLFFYALNLTKNQADAEDLVSNAFLKAFVILEDADENIYAWLVKVVRHMWIDELRKRKHQIDEGSFHVEWIEDPKDIMKEMIHNEKVAWMYEQIFCLPIVEREILLLSLTMDVRDQDIADLLKLSVENVRVIRHRAKNKLIKKASAFEK